MKHFLKSIVAGLLALLARGILLKYRPKVVMVTGSVGKTSTKDAVAAALHSTFHLRASEKSYNSEFGVPLTIIGAKNPWTNPYAWVRVIGEALALIFLPNHYPKLLVLEVGADSPGDLKRILHIATPDVVVVTKLPEVPVHVEAYASAAAVREEEFAPAYALPAGAPLIISADDPYAKHLASRLSAQVTTYGFEKDADVHLTDAKVLLSGTTPLGMHSNVTIGKTTHALTTLGALGRPQLYAPAAAVACALALGMTTKDALKALESYVPPSGRARILKGKNSSVLLDDSYNASPSAVEEALSSLSLVPAKRRIAVLGDMLELGRYSAEEHERIGKLAAKHADIVVGVGPRSKKLSEAAFGTHKNKNRAHHFDEAYAAAVYLSGMIETGDVILVKGSQSIRVERIVEALLADGNDTAHLVRQEREWKKR